MVSRLGCSVPELLVAITVLGVGVLGAAGTAALAARILREAAARERAVAAGALVMDSLLEAAVLEPGERDVDQARVRWSVHVAGAATRIDMVVEYRDGTRTRQLDLAAWHVPPPHRLKDPQ